MKYVLRTAWYLSNLLSQISFACKLGWRDGHGPSPKMRPRMTKEGPYVG